MEEHWKDVEGFEDLYSISDTGKVLSKRSGRIRKTSVNNSGHECIRIYKNKKQYNFTIHRLVAMTFIPNPLSLKEINHIDENKLNNNVQNLEWCTRKYNQEYSGNIKKFVNAGAAAVKRIRSKKVVQYTLDGEFIKEWLSAREAEAALGIARTGIGKCCLGQYKQCGGYLWSF